MLRSKCPVKHASPRESGLLTRSNDENRDAILTKLAQKRVLSLRRSGPEQLFMSLVGD